MLFGNRNNIVTEAYVGQTSTLKKAEVELKKVLEMIYAFDNVSFETGKLVNYSSACKNFCDLLSKEFGTKILVNFTPQDPHGAGAYTYVTSTIWDYTNVVQEYNRSGRIRTTPNMFPIYVTVAYPVINNYRLTSDEVMGIILHEIGHNITHVPIINSLNLVAMLLRPPVGALISSLDRLATIIEGVPVVNQLIRFSNLFNKFVSDMTGDRLNAFLTFYRLVIDGGYKLILNLDPIKHFGGYAGERYSDSLATAYGYGKGLSNALLKIHAPTAPSTYNKAVNSNVVTAFGDIFLLTFSDICTMITMRGVHPKVGHRIKNSLNKLERDLKTGSYPPEVKASLEKDVKELRKIYQSYLDADESNKNEVVSFYRNYIERYGINPLRNLVLDEAYASIEV